MYHACVIFVVAGSPVMVHMGELMHMAENKQRKKIPGVLFVLAAAAIVLIVALVMIPGNRYRKAVALQQAGKYGEAISAFQALNGYGDSAAQIEACRTGIKERAYQAAAALRQAGKYEEAISAFEALNGYGDAAEQITETKYMEAAAQTANGDYTSAVSIFNSIRGYKDVNSLLENDDHLVAAREAKRAAFQTVGSYVTFGVYPQTSSGTDETGIEWLVLDYDAASHRALLLSRYELDATPYNTRSTDITWENCTLRKWLNGYFFNRAFRAEEQAAIMITEVDNGPEQGYSGWDTSGGNATQDRIFLLSYAEAMNMSKTASIAAPTAYAISEGAFVSTEGSSTGWWWLRSPGRYQYSAARVRYDGTPDYSSISYEVGGVRPAFWLNLESDLF